MLRFVLCISLAVISAHVAWADEPAGIKLLRETKDVEVAPGKWLTLKQIDRVIDEESPSIKRLPNSEAIEKMRKEEWTALTIPWHSTTVHWKGADIPISLREWNGLLHIIGYDRSQDKYRLRYYAQKDDGFSEIKATDYPKKIATQNLWFGSHDVFDGGGRKIDDVELAVKLDPQDIHFVRSLTATIWCELMTGKPYEEVKQFGDERRQMVVREYSEKYSPLKLTQIVRTKEKK